MNDTAVFTMSDAPWILHAASRFLSAEMHDMGAVMLYLLARMKTMELTLSSRSDLALF
jgi:hypothetical protein